MLAMTISITRNRGGDSGPAHRPGRIMVCLVVSSKRPRIRSKPLAVRRRDVDVRGHALAVRGVASSSTTVTG